MSLFTVILRAAAAGAAVAALGACSTLPVTTDVNPYGNVAACHTYTFAQEHVANLNQPAAFGNPVNADRLKAAIQVNLAVRGMQLVADPRSADCVVGYAMGSRLVADDWGGVGLYGGYGWGRHGWGYGGAWAWDYPYEQGRVSVDLFDAKTRIAIWHASVNQYVGDATGPDAAAKINQAAAAIFTKFPVVLGVPAAPVRPATS
jgi:hypothetical protein